MMEKVIRKSYYEIRGNLLIIYEREIISARKWGISEEEQMEGALIPKGYINLRNTDTNVNNIKKRLDEFLVEEDVPFSKFSPSHKHTEVYLLEQNNIPLLFKK